MRPIDLIVIHCSDSPFGDAALIDRWHRSRGWKGIGYHFVILNGYPTAESLRLRRPEWWRDGVIESGRPLEQIGAHLRGKNARSIGVCLIGRDQFTCAQLMALETLVGRLHARFGAVAVMGHYEAQSAGSAPKSCPNLDMEWLRMNLKSKGMVMTSQDMHRLRHKTAGHPLLFD